MFKPTMYSSTKENNHINFLTTIPIYNFPYLRWTLSFSFFTHWSYPYFFTSKEPDVPSLITDDQLEQDLDELKSHQQQVHSTNKSLEIYKLTHSASTSSSSTPFVHIGSTRAGPTRALDLHEFM